MNRVAFGGIFERIADSPAAVNGIRPGGIELTRRAVYCSGLSTGSEVLDVGCGVGVTVEYLMENGILATGIDVSNSLLSKGKTRNNAMPLVAATAAALPYRDGCFDGVIFECMLSLVSDREGVLKECSRILKSSGKLIVADLYVSNLKLLEKQPHQPRRTCLQGAFGKSELIDLLTAAGFGVDLLEDHSAMLRDFAVRLIWTYGSLDWYWKESGMKEWDSMHVGKFVRAARPGYFLCVGTKITGGPSSINLQGS